MGDREALELGVAHQAEAVAGRAGATASGRLAHGETVPAQGRQGRRRQLRRGYCGHSHAAPRTPEASPWELRRIGVSSTSVNT